MIGVYKITNNLNHKSYIGISTDIEHRWEQHKNPYNWKRESNKTLYKAFQKYGLENFTFSVIEECDVKDLSQKEEFYIQYYNSLHNGYNMTAGGQTNQGESHPKHKLTEQDVIDIRTRYGNLERKNEVYQLYKDRIGESGFHKIWTNATWKNIKQEVYTPENKQFHKNNTANSGSKNGRAKLTEEEVRSIRLRKKNKEPLAEVYKDYSDRMTYKSFVNVWSYQNWKNIIV